jgi:hypothetical protein
MRQVIFILAPILLLNMNSIAQQDSVNVMKQNEILFGLGAAKSFEKNIFNLSDDVEGGTNLGITIAYFRHLNEHWAIGINLFGYMKTVDDMMILRNSNFEKAKFDVSLVNIGGEVKYYFSRRSVEPFCLAFLAYSSGSLQNDQLGTLNLSGVSGGMGAGMGIPVAESFIITLEALCSLGSADWKEPPFLNSDGSDFNPSFIAVFGEVSYRF